LIESGADIVIGAHPHVLQGIEFYQGSPIIYSLGNFWFNTGWVRTALLEIELNAQGEYRLRVHPCMTAGGSTSLMEEEADRQALFRHLEGLSTGIVIESDGVVTTIN
jgi:poly-gamma-glutamate synthesis protein (capsule biosynthesis protein)